MRAIEEWVQQRIDEARTDVQKNSTLQFWRALPAVLTGTWKPSIFDRLEHKVAPYLFQLQKRAHQLALPEEVFEPPRNSWRLFDLSQAATVAS